MEARNGSTIARPRIVRVIALRLFLRRNLESLLFLAFVGQSLLFFATFPFWPSVNSAWLSLHRWNMIAPVKRFVGLENYRYLAQNPVFRTVLRNSVVHTIGPAGGTLLFALGPGLLLNQPLRGRDGAKAVLFAPSRVSGAAIGFVRIYLFAPRFGVIARLLGIFGLASPTWLSGPLRAMAALSGCLWR